MNYETVCATEDKSPFQAICEALSAVRKAPRLCVTVRDTQRQWICDVLQLDRMIVVYSAAGATWMKLRS